MKIVVLSDTHGLLRPEVIEQLAGADAIIHGGDINRQDIVDTLRSYAPLYIVRGNNDKEWATDIPHDLRSYAPLYIVRGNNDKEWATDIPHDLRLELGGVRFFMVHNKKEVPKDLTDVDVIVFGHSHKYFQEEKDGVLWLNPGCCGKRRFDQEITYAVMTVEDGRYSVIKENIPH